MFRKIVIALTACLALSACNRPEDAKAPSQGVQIAGDPERTARAQRQRDGIAVDDQTWQEILDAGRKVGVVLSC